jgi:hypothetical protein
MTTFHAKPYCWGDIGMSQDRLKQILGPTACPKCKQTITVMDVTDSFQLIDCISLIKVKRDSQVVLF